MSSNGLATNGLNGLSPQALYLLANRLSPFTAQNFNLAMLANAMYAPQLPLYSPAALGLQSAGFDPQAQQPPQTDDQLDDVLSDDEGGAGAQPLSQNPFDQAAGPQAGQQNAQTGAAQTEQPFGQGRQRTGRRRNQQVSADGLNGWKKNRLNGQKPEGEHFRKDWKKNRLNGQKFEGRHLRSWNKGNNWPERTARFHQEHRFHQGRGFGGSGGCHGKRHGR